MFITVKFWETLSMGRWLRFLIGGGFLVGFSAGLYVLLLYAGLPSDISALITFILSFGMALGALGVVYVLSRASKGGQERKIKEVRKARGRSQDIKQGELKSRVVSVSGSAGQQGNDKQGPGIKQPSRNSISLPHSMPLRAAAKSTFAEVDRGAVMQAAMRLEAEVEHDHVVRPTASFGGKGEAYRKDSGAGRAAPAAIGSEDENQEQKAGQEGLMLLLEKRERTLLELIRQSRERLLNIEKLMGDHITLVNSLVISSHLMAKRILMALERRLEDMGIARGKLLTVDELNALFDSDMELPTDSVNTLFSADKLPPRPRVQWEHKLEESLKAAEKELKAVKKGVLRSW